MTYERTVLAKHRAARGAAVLDRDHPGWADRINTRDLSIACSDRCICGQLGLWDTGAWNTSQYATDHGVLSGKGVSASDLTEAWLDEIRVRREELVPA